MIKTLGGIAFSCVAVILRSLSLAGLVYVGWTYLIMPQVSASAAFAAYAIPLPFKMLWAIAAVFLFVKEVVPSTADQRAWFKLMEEDGDDTLKYRISMMDAAVHLGSWASMGLMLLVI